MDKYLQEMAQLGLHRASSMGLLATFTVVFQIP